MKLLLISSLLFISAVCEAKGKLESRLEYMRISSEIDSSLAPNCSVYEFIFSGVSAEGFTILYSIDGEDGQAEIDVNGRLIVNSSPGKHIFQFFTWHYSEVFTDSLPIEGRSRDVWEIVMSTSLFPVDVGKPVIYLYPEVPTIVQVKIDIKGENHFYYPEYENGWEANVLPNGEIYMGDKVYNYLFWEAKSHAAPIVRKDGFIVSKSNVISFLEKQLTTAGLSSKEQADFITFWAPRLVQHDQCFVHFIFNEACNEFGRLTITPNPDNVYRIYMQWQPIETIFPVAEQQIQTMNREGFTVLEWGGMELPAATNRESD